MAARLSRRKIAGYMAEQLLAGNDTVILQLAALLVDERRTHELPLIVRDIEALLVTQGTAVADVASARELSAAVKKAITAFVRESTGAASVQLRETVDTTLLGGVKISLPGQELDATLRRRVTQLKASKV